MNGVVGAVETHADKAIEWSARARDLLKADLIVFPELTLVGYPPDDLLLRPDLYHRVQLALAKLTSAIRGIDVVIGYPEKDREGNLFNTAVLLREGHIAARYHKQYLPNYGVFDEKRYFTQGCQEPCLIEIKGIKIGLCICEDLWHVAPSAQVAKAGGSALLCLNASPFDAEKQSARDALLRQRAVDNGLTIFYVNWVGGQDELVFDGDASVTDARGVRYQQAPLFEEALMPVDFNLAQTNTAIQFPISDPSARVYQALVLSVRDYVTKNNFSSVVMGLSGGIDSALVLAIAVDALGADRVSTYMLPSRHTSQMSVELAAAMAKGLDVDHTVISIEPAFKALMASLSGSTSTMANKLTKENLQARCRGVLLMAISNEKNALVLSSSNKSELAVGYCTLYGDTVGAFNVLKDVLKTRVYTLARYRNRLANKAIIPEGIIEREPTAELAHNQRDAESLPPYDILDAIVARYVEQDESIETICKAGFDRALVEKVVQLITRSEYKRSQAPIGPRISKRAFGRERRYPITSR